VADGSSCAPGGTKVERECAAFPPLTRNAQFASHGLYHSLGQRQSQPIAQNLRINHCRAAVKGFENVFKLAAPYAYPTILNADADFPLAAVFRKKSPDRDPLLIASIF
jgi:hypothetical protein